MAFGLIAGLPYRGPGSFAGKGGGAGKSYSAATSRLGQLGGIGRSKAAAYSGKSATAVVFSVRHARLGNLTGIGRAGGPYTGKVSTPDNDIEYDNLPVIGLAGSSYDVLTDNVIDYAGVEVYFTSNDYEVIQGGQVISYTNHPELLLTTSSYTVEQLDPINQYVDYTPGSLTLTGSTYVVAQDNVITYTNQAAIFLMANTYEVVPGVLGEQTLSNADYAEIATRVANKQLALGMTLQQSMSVILAATAGTAFNFKPAGQAYAEGEEFGYYGTDGVTKVIKATYVGGNRVIIELNPEG